MASRKKRQNTEHLSLYMNGVQVGQLARSSSGALAFTYEQTWLDRDHPFPISRQLPLQESSFSGKQVRDYFDNLLPDDPRVREKLVSLAQANSKQAFDLLSALGRDCVGALQFYPKDQQPGPLTPAKGTPVDESKIAEILRNLRINPLGITHDSEFRISLAGAQSKTALLWHKNRWMIPEGPTPTTHILKPAIGKHQDGPDFSLSIENEWLCLKIMSAFGLKVADAEILEFEDIKALSVKRFDREWSNKILYRIPQEDLCQALGISPEHKYESDGGPGIGTIISLLNESDNRDEDREIFMKTQLIFWLLAAIDGHAKNFSLYIREKGFVLTPIYDVISADPHINPKTLPFEKIKMAMAIGDNRHYKIKGIRPRHWEQTAAKNKFPNMNDLINEIAKNTHEVIEKVQSQLPSKFPKKVSDPIFKAMRDRSKLLKKS